jgi:CHASE3 domain sensor protein
LIRKLQFAFGLVLAILLIVGLLSYRTVMAFRESDRLVRHTRQVLENLQDLVFAMESIETSNRGFVLTGKESYEESYRASMAIVEQRIATVRNLTVVDPQQQSRLPTLEMLVAQKIQFSEMVISLRRAKGLEAAAGAIQSGLGQRTMEGVLGVIVGMKNKEYRLLLQRDAEADRRFRHTKVVLLLGSTLGLLIAVGAGWTVRRDFAARERAEKALREGEERFRTLANNISQLAWMADEKGWIFWYNQRWKDGWEVLGEIKGNPHLQTNPVVLLTTSASEADILKSYLLHANCYITKPVNLDAFLKVVKSIDSFW